MTELQKYFFARLNLKEKESIAFEDLSELLISMAQAVPFENLDIVKGNVKAISKENLQEKILINQRGGLCYELNPIMYYFLKDCCFDVHLVSGTVYDSASETWAVDEGHVATVLIHNNELYLIEVGFGSFLPLIPVPFTGEVVHSVTGDYRIRKETTEKGTYILEMRKNNDFLDVASSEEWKLGYAFDIEKIDEQKLNQAQKIIVEHERSPFNKVPIVVKLTDDGHVSLTKDSFTRTKNGEKSKELITEQQYTELLHTVFGIKL
ncbi:arylamine N-acetyltransferase [Bacillus sp. DX1.1]|uniref:arylamine N-acetyltransferase family protein n=1 Tax=unclassified Bacillus (in: firmicutes) TaxID=185979 RepID=UPI0025709A8A|nr:MULTISPECIES: arylamine N-acetyltransferase [unclassified Bacillus (in: firmicutes)]MDM5155664.1 arylamine N-acetyltransferase [Bacillus sp. DX1.1]WJE79969.1 arylamine N-acetyltransferase [Bacillus sp. DX3.1]